MKRNRIDTVAAWLPALFALLLPVGKVYPVIVVFLMGAAALRRGAWARTAARMARSHGIKVQLLYYGLLLAGLAWTANLPEGLFDLQVKSSLVLFPLLLFGYGAEAPLAKRIYPAFLAGNAAACLFCLGRSLARFRTGGTGADVFFYDQFSCFLHPSYFAMYLNACILLCLFWLKGRFGPVRRGMKMLLYAAIGLYALAVFLSASKMGVLAGAFLLAGGLFWLFWKRQRVFWVLATGLALTAAMLVNSSSLTMHRLMVGMDVFFFDKQTPKQEGTKSRMHIFNSGVDVARDNLWWGVGTGDVKDALAERFKRSNNRIEVALHYNAHNQFLQGLLATGMFGLLLVVLLVILPAVSPSAWRDGLYPCFLWLITLNFAVESMLETQAGVLFFAFFNTLFLRMRAIEKHPDLWTY